MFGFIKRMSFWPSGYHPAERDPQDADKKALIGETPQTAGYQSVGYHHWGMYPRDMPVFTMLTVQQMLLDPTVRLGLAMRAAPLMSLQWGWKDGETWNTGIQAQNPQVAEFVERQLKRIWGNGLDAVLSAQIWGWSSGEITHRMTPGGLVEIDKLHPRHANDVRARTQASKLTGCRVLRCQSGGTGYVDLDFPKAWWHAFMPEAGLHYGYSALLGCYSPWWDKWMQGGALDVRRLFMHKDAYAGADLAYPEGSVFIPGKGEVPNRDIAREIVEQLVAGGVTTFPSDPGADGKNRWQLTRAQVASNPGHILQYPKDLDVEILRGLEIADDVLAVDGSGSWAGKKIPMAAFYAGLDRWATALVRDLDEQAIRPLVEMNFGEGQEYEISHKPLAEQAMEQQQDDGKGGQPGGGDDSYADLFGGEQPGGPRPQPPRQQPGQPPGPARMALRTEAEQVVSAVNRIIRMRTEDKPGERWITIGGRKDGEDEHAGGFPVKINADGEIVAGGPKGLRGKKVSEIYKHFKRMRNTPAAKEKRYQGIVKKQAKAWRISPEEYQQFADEVHKEKMNHHQAREGAKAYARKTLGVTAADINRWENQGLDYSSKKLSKYAFDRAGQSIASQFPDLGWGGGYGDGQDEGGHDAKLWDLLREGKVDPPSRHSPEFHADVDEYLQYLASQSPGGLDDAPDAEDTSFDFGALASDDDEYQRFALEVVRLARQKRLFDDPGGASRRQARIDFDEEDHPRGADGEFVKKGSSEERAAGGKKEEEKAAPNPVHTPPESEVPEADDSEPPEADAPEPESTGLTDRQLFTREGHQFENIQRALGVKKPVTGPKGVENIRKALDKHPGGKVIEALLGVPDEGQGHGESGFSKRGIDLYRKTVDGKFSKEELKAAGDWMQTAFSVTGQVDDHWAQRFVRDAVITATPKGGAPNPVHEPPAPEVPEADDSEPPEDFTLKNAPPAPKPDTFEDMGGKQQGLFSKAGLPGQQNLFADAGVPEDMVAKKSSEKSSPAPVDDLSKGRYTEGQTGGTSQPASKTGEGGKMDTKQIRETIEKTLAGYTNRDGLVKRLEEFESTGKAVQLSEAAVDFYKVSPASRVVEQMVSAGVLSAPKTDKWYQHQIGDLRKLGTGHRIEGNPPSVFISDDMTGNVQSVRITEPTREGLEAAVNEAITKLKPRKAATKARKRAEREVDNS